MGGSGGTMNITGIILLVVFGGFFFYAIWSDKKKKSAKMAKDEPKNSKSTRKKQKKKEAETVQELLDYDSISDKGIVKLKSGDYTATIELTQINQHLNNINENAGIWKKFRSMLNSISVRETLLVQSQYLDVMDFVNDYNTQSEAIQNLTPQLQEARQDVVQNYKEFAEQKTREYRAYIIFRFNPKKDGLDKGLETGNAILDNLLAAARGQVNELDEEEEVELAESVLEEVIDLAYQMLHSNGSQAVRLNRSGILSLTYSTLNRDLAISQRINDISNAHGFSEFKQSLSPYYFEQEMKRNNEYATVFSYEEDSFLNPSQVNAEIEIEEELEKTFQMQ